MDIFTSSLFELECFYRLICLVCKVNVNTTRIGKHKILEEIFTSIATVSSECNFSITWSAVTATLGPRRRVSDLSFGK